MHASHRIIVIGTSAGGVEALKELAGALPADFPAAILVVLHLLRDSPSMLPHLLSRAGPLPAAHPIDGESIRAGRIYVAPPDLHMVVRQGQVYLRRGPRENNSRPAIDPLFRSAAIAYGPAAVGVILTGNLYDGTAGLLSIKAHGGIAIVQDPEDAAFRSMPESAIRAVEVDHCLPLAEIPARLVSIAGREVATNPKITARDPDVVEVTIAEGVPDSLELLKEVAQPSPYTCPECHGALWTITDERMLRFRCRVGHAYTADSLLDLQDQDIENALWSAVRALEERAALAKRMVDRTYVLNLGDVRQRFRTRQEESEHHAGLLRKLLLRGVEKDSQE
ncbi:chemotaxis protein CheB [Azoarcus sp. KH32C]|uniref:chemotaxis protein CheB n=1 Tax=Azoarcus sp. KH32C TaxID=748247 RepID=UPI0002385EAE|nr:chemotaxis protein CheB [Azoarcus sp. KH32C]BAL23972.1 two-component system, chemotaxis family, response regulator [Azoarcus sp. KH32C]